MSLLLSFSMFLCLFFSNQSSHVSLIKQDSSEYLNVYACQITVENDKNKTTTTGKQAKSL